MSTNFFEQQDVARRKTGWLVLFFVLAVVLIVLAVYLVFVIALTSFQGASEADATGRSGPSALDPVFFAWVSLGTIAVILLGSLYKISELSSGGEAVALMLGGRQIDPQSGKLPERQLLNVVEEMALASGTPVPPVYVLDKESSINAADPSSCCPKCPFC